MKITSKCPRPLTCFTRFSFRNIDEWLLSFEQCTTHLLTRTKSSIDLYELTNHLLKYFPIFTTNAIHLLRTLIQFFVSQEAFDQKHLSKLFANFLKHKNFLDHNFHHPIDQV